MAQTNHGFILGLRVKCDASKYMGCVAEVLWSGWKKSLCTKRIKPAKAPYPIKEETLTIVKSVAIGPWAPDLSDGRVQDAEESREEVPGTLGCLLPPSLQANM